MTRPRTRPLAGGLLAAAVSTTIVYGSLVAFIAVTYVIIVAGLGALGSGSLHAGSRPSFGLSILATAVVAVAFQSVRSGCSASRTGSCTGSGPRRMRR